MRLFRWWRHNTEGLEQAKRADAEAEARLREAKNTSQWVQNTLDTNNLTGRFFDTLRHGGKA